MPEQETVCTCAEDAPEEALLAQLDAFVADERDKPGALIPVLQYAQGVFGYLPEAALKRIALAMEMPYSEVAGVVSFYSFFSTVPRGKHLIRVCQGTACYVRGGKRVLDALRDRLGINVGETTPDRRFTLEVARCFGSCGLAPAIMVDDEVIQRVKPTKVQQILDRYADPDEEAEAKESRT